MDFVTEESDDNNTTSHSLDPALAKIPAQLSKEHNANNDMFNNQGFDNINFKQLEQKLG